MSPDTRSRPRLAPRKTRRLPPSVLQRWCAVLAEIGAATNRQAALDAATQGLHSLLHSTQCAAILYQSSEYTLEAAVPGSDPLLGLMHNTPARLPHIPHTYSIDNGQTGENQEALVVPIVRNDTPIGLLAIANRVSRPRPSNDTLYLQHTAKQVAQTIERIELQETAERRAAELAAVSDTSVVISSQLDLQATLQTIVEQAARLARADGGSLYLVDEACGELEIVVSYRLDHDYRGERVKIGEGVAGRAAASSQIVHVVDYSRWDGRAPHFNDSPFHAVLAVPLLQEGRVLGVIDLVHNTAPHAFDNSDIAAVRLLAEQAVVAITNARLYDAANQVALQMSALARASQLLDAQGDVDASILPLAEAGMFVLNAHACLILSAALPTPEIICRLGLDDTLATQLRNVIAPLFVSTDGRSELQLTHDARNTCESNPIDRIALDSGFRSRITLPLLREDRYNGSVTFLFEQAHTWYLDEIEITQVLANQLAALIANAQLYGEAQEANRLKSEFIATVSHELRTPMGAIIGYAELLQNGLYGPLDESIREPIDRIKSNGDQLLHLINQMLDLSRIEAGRLELHVAPFHPHDLMHAVAAAIQPQVAAKGVRFHTEVDAAIPGILYGDVGRLRQMLLCLCNNSAKFTQQGTIAVRCFINDESPAQLVFEVRDTGVGISPDQLETIWEPFRQGNSTISRPFGGTGLGLALVQKLTHLMRGHVSVTSAIGVGSTFNVRLPLLSPDGGNANSSPV